VSRVFSSLRQRSHSGEAMRCGDGVTRVLYPGILIESQDGEEANYFCACRASGHANHPCPKCLVDKNQLHNITGTFEPRTSESMRAVIRRASRAETKIDKEKILKAFGLHDIPVRSNCRLGVGLAFENICW
jgi:Plavaka transposase